MTEATVIEAPKPRARRRKSTAVATLTPANVPAVQQDRPTALTLIQRVMTDPTVSVERVNQAFDLYERLEKAEARRAFDAAMADAKAKIPPIAKNRLVSHETKTGGTKSYRHEDMAGIATVIDPILAELGLSYRFRVSSDINEPIRVTCIVAHRMGYSEETTLTAGADSTGNKNSIQAIGSTVTYLQRYTLKAALGLSASNDDDGQAATPAPDTVSEAQLLDLIALADDVQADKDKFCRFFKIEKMADLPAARFEQAIGMLNKKRAA